MMVPGAAVTRLGLAEVHLLPQRCAWLPQQRLLVAADLHLGKGETFQSWGLPVPATGTAELEVLQRLAMQLAAHRVIILGDVIHSVAGLSAALEERVHRWVMALGHPPLLCLGNHDRKGQGQLKTLGFEIETDTWISEGLSMTHVPEDLPADYPGIAGHWHPVLRLSAAGERVRPPVFVRTGEHLVLPSLGRFTGGREIVPRDADALWAVGPAAVVPAGPTRRN